MGCPCGSIDIDEMPVTINLDCPVHGRNKRVIRVVSDPIKVRQEALELIASCAKDVVDYWPSMSFKTIRVMIPKMQALKEALEMLK